MKIFRNLTLRKRGFLLISAGLIVLFVIQTVQKVAILNTLTRMILEERLTLAYTVAQDLDNDLNDLLDGLEHFSTNPNMRLMDNDMEPEREELQAFHDPDSYQYIFILDKEGKVLLTEPFLPDVVGGTTMVNCPHVKKVLDTGESGVACINHALTPLRPVIAPMVPIYDDQGIVAGVLGVAIDPASPSFSGLLEEALHGQEVHAEIIDENGTVLAHTQGKNLFRLNDHANLFIPLVENKQPLMDIQLLEEDGEKSEMVIAFAPLSTVSWGVVIEQPKAELLAPVYEATRQTLYFSVAAILTALLVVWVSIESIVKPIKRLSVASQSLANGDFGTSLEITGNGEIAELGQGFEAMRRKLESWNAEMEAAVRKRTHELSKYKTILDNLNEQVVVIDDNYCIINANQPFLQATGLQYPDVIGRHCHEISHRSPIPCWQGKNGGQNCPVLKVWQNGHSARSLHKHYDAAGMPIWIELTASPLLNDIGGLTAVIEVIRDVTIEKRHSTLLTNILELSTQLATMNEEGPLLKTLVTRGALLAESSTFTVMLIDEKRDEAYILAENGLPDGSTGLRVPLKLPLFRPFMESGKPIIIPDIDRYAPEMRTILVRRDIQSFFVYPIVRKNGRPIGFITISKLTPYSPSDGEITAYTLLAERTGAALENLGLYKNLRDLSIAISRSLANAIDARDPYTRGHSEEVARLAVQLGRKLDLDSVELEMLEFAALLHDIGKIAVPDTILQKTGRLSPSDWDILHMHPYYSAQIIRPIGSMERIVPWIYHHHERWDGRGYPDGLAGENIPLPARIIALADSYNAMMTDRPYRKRLGREETILEIESNAGIQFDPLITKKFLKLIMK